MLKSILQSFMQLLSKIFYMVKKIPLPIQLFMVIGFVFLFGDYIPEDTARLFYTFSLLFKSFLLFFLPFMLFVFVFNGILSFHKSAPAVLLILLAAMFISNVIIAVVSYVTARTVLPSIVQSMIVQQLAIQKSLVPLIPMQFIEFGFITQYFKYFTLDKVLMASITLGIIFSFFSLPRFEETMFKFKGVIEKILKYGFVPLLPVYVLGYLLAIHHEGVFKELFSHYGKALLLILAIQVVYLCFFYFAAEGFSPKKAWRSMKNAFPAYLTGFSTMSSMVALPISIDAAEENTHNRPLAEMSMPIMANLHFAGVATNMPILALATMMIFWGVIPEFSQYLIFVLYLCYTMIAISGVPGSGIILMVPILISQFGFSPEMISVVTALYLLFESFGTAANVFGDGALIIVVNKIIKKLGLA